MKANSLHVGEYEFYSITAPKLNSRFPEYSMTNDPEKVWPRGIVHYVMDTTLSKLLITCTCSIQACMRHLVDIAIMQTQVFI